VAAGFRHCYLRVESKDRRQSVHEGLYARPLRLDEHALVNPSDKALCTGVLGRTPPITMVALATSFADPLTDSKPIGMLQSALL
jgi:hypothetical protein